MATENDLIETQPQSQSSAFSALMLELAKCLKLVAPITMSADAQMVWLQAAVDALEGIQAHEVKAISAELRRSVTRVAQIVPEIAKLVHERRKRPVHRDPSPFAAEMAIQTKAQEMRSQWKGDQQKIEDAWAWERQARINAGLHVPPLEPRLSREELDNMLPHIRQLGISKGFLEYRDGQLVETCISPTGGR
jgi:hypothetical protein